MTGIVVAPQVEAAEQAVAVLRGGGNAVDAAVTGAFVQGVIDPQMCGIGGGGVMVVHDAQAGTNVVLEFFPRAGSLVRDDQWVHAFRRPAAHPYGYVLDGALNDVGYQSIGVPGTVRGLYEALARFGTISWERAIAPAIAIASRGFPVSSFMREDWEFNTGPDVVPHARRLQATPEARRIFTRRGSLYRVGELMVLEDYARTLREIAAGGPDAFYRGQLAKTMVADFEANGASITAEDLALYKVDCNTPVEGTYRGTRIVAPGPPAGGVALIQLMNYLEGCDLRGRAWPSTTEAALRADAMAWVFAEQQRHMMDPRFGPVPLDEMIDKDRAARARRERGAGERPARKPYADAPTTTQLSVGDDAGNAVSLTHTLGTWSGVVTPTLGFGYNNYLSAFDPRPGRRNSLAPGKTRVTMMSPTLTFDGDRLSGLIGGVGGNKILTGVGQCLVNLLEHGMSPVESVSAARVHCDGGSVHLERRIPSYVQDGLERLGYGTNRHPLSYDIFFALVQVVAFDQYASARGASDPRGDGGVALVA